ncbi:MAG TPA: hypothetical protein VNX68_02175, partial [Nitrosopumilaceae archaeon]|nr:hypothetical protein [Nitrosopumilaceae archaeon]
MNNSARAIHYTYLAGLDPRQADGALLPGKLFDDFSSYKKSYSKKPLVAGVLSMLVPGLGKLYIGKRKSFLNTLVINTVYGVQSYESIRKFGISNTFSLLNVGIFSVFYVANI